MCVMGGANYVCAQQNTLSVEDHSLMLYDKLMFQDVVKLYENNSLPEDISPYSIMLLCSALYELDSNVEQFFKRYGSNSHIYKFAIAYNDLLNGDINAAKSKFQRLKHSSALSESYLGIVGLFETSIFLQNYVSLESLIDDTSSEKKMSDDIEEAILYYSLLYSSLTSDFASASKIITEMDKKVVNSELTIKMIDAEIKVSENKISDALKIVNEAISTLGPFQELLLLKSSILSLRNGHESGLQFIENVIDDNDYMWQLKLTKYFQLLGKVEHDKPSDVVSKIVAIANDRRKDIPTLLSICNGLLDYGYHVEAGNLINLFFGKTKNQFDFFMSNLFMAKFHYFLGEKTRFEVSLNAAKQQAPNDIGLLLFLYDLAIEDREYNQANQILDKILLSDPYNIEVLYEKITTCAALKQWGNVISLSDQFFNIGRYAESEVKEEIALLRKDATSKEKGVNR